MRIIAWLTIWTAVVFAAARFDSDVAWKMRNSGIENYLHTHAHIREILKTPGEYWFTILVMILMLLFHAKRWRAALTVLLGTAISGANGLIKWIVGRTRPFKLHENLAEPFVLHPFRDGLPGLFRQTNLCFPSGHAALAFATAAAAGMLLPKWRWGFYAVATIVAAERIAENAHWLSDTVAAAMLGIGGVWIIRRFWWERFSGNQRGSI